MNVLAGVILIGDLKIQRFQLMDQDLYFNWELGKMSIYIAYTSVYNCYLGPDPKKVHFSMKAHFFLHQTLFF